MRHWRGRVAGFVAGLLLGGWLIATPAAQSYVWGAVNGIPFGPGLVLSPGPLTVTGGTLSGATATSLLTLSQTWNTTGAPVLVDWTITDTASDAASLAFRIRGGAAGTTTLLSVGKTGRLTVGENIVVPNNAYYTMTSRFAIGSASEGTVTATNSTVTGLTTLNLGPTTGNSASGTTTVGHVVTTLDMATATGTGTGTITSPTTAIPAGTMVKGVSCRVTTVLAGAGLTTFSIGDGTDVDRWGAAIAIALNTNTNISNYTIASPVNYAAATSIVLTAAAGVFSTGVLKCTTHYESHIPIGS